MRSKWLKKKYILNLLILPILTTIFVISFWQHDFSIQKLHRSLINNVEIATNQIGFTIQNIEIIGRKEVDKNIIEALVKPLIGKNTFFAPLSAISDQVQQLDWVEKVALRRSLPNKINLYIIERVPIAIWQKNKKYTLIDKKGTPLKVIDPIFSKDEQSINFGDHNDKIIITGDHSPQYVFFLLKILDRHPWLHHHIKAASLIHARRWNIYLRNEVAIFLPETGLDMALTKVTKILKNHNFLLQHIKSIDLRLENRVTIKHNHKKILLPSSKGKRI